MVTTGRPLEDSFTRAVELLAGSALPALPATGSFEMEKIITVIPLGRGRRKHVTYMQHMKACGKPTCKTCGGRALAHGPYWHSVEYDTAAKKRVCRWVGVQLPAEAEAVLIAERSTAPALALEVARLRRRLADAERKIADLRRRQRSRGRRASA